MPLGTAEPLRWSSERALGCRMETVSCQPPKEQSFLASPWRLIAGKVAWESRVTREPGLSLGMLEGTQGTMPRGDEHWHGLSLPLD